MQLVTLVSWEFSDHESCQKYRTMLLVIFTVFPPNTHQSNLLEGKPITWACSSSTRYCLLHATLKLLLSTVIGTGSSPSGWELCGYNDHIGWNKAHKITHLSSDAIHRDLIVSVVISGDVRELVRRHVLNAKLDGSFSSGNVTHCIFGAAVRNKDTCRLIVPKCYYEEQRLLKYELDVRWHISLDR